VLALLALAVLTSSTLDDAIAARVNELQAHGTVVELSTTRRAALSRGLEIVEVHGQIGGVPIEQPIGFALEGGARGRRVLPSMRGLGPVSGPSTPKLTARDAIAIVEALPQPGTRGATEARLVWASTPVGLRLSYIVDPPLDFAALSNAVFRVDATTGRAVKIHDHVTNVAARAYPENPVTTPTPENFELVAIDDPPLVLAGPFVDVVSCIEPTDGTFPGSRLPQCDLARYAVPDAAGDFVDVEPEPSIVVDDGFAETSAYYHADRFLAFMDPFGVEGLHCDQRLGERSTIVVNYRQEPLVPLSNAFYTGDCPVAVLMGDGDDVDHAYDGDLVYHELGHSVVQEMSGYLGAERGLDHAWVHDANAVNEAVADYLSSVVTGDPVMGEATIARDIDTDAACPADLWGEPHDDGLVISGGLWRFHQMFGTDFVPIVLDVLTLIRNDVLFEEFAETLAVLTGLALGPEAEAVVRDEYTERGVFGCERVLPAEASTVLRLLPTLELEPFRPPPLQLVVSVPPGAARATIQYRFAQWDPEPLAANLLWRVGEPVRFDYGGEDGTMVEATYDGAATDQPAEGAVSIDLEPSDETTELFVAFASRSSEDVWATFLDVAFDPAEPSATSTGADETSSSSSGDPSSTTSDAEDTTSGDVETDPAAEPREASDGCGCSTRRSSGLPLVLLLLPLLRPRRVEVTRCVVGRICCALGGRLRS
jgi:hypothetical protein